MQESGVLPVRSRFAPRPGAGLRPEVFQSRSREEIERLCAEPKTGPARMPLCTTKRTTLTKWSNRHFRPKKPYFTGIKGKAKRVAHDPLERCYYTVPLFVVLLFEREKRRALFHQVDRNLERGNSKTNNQEKRAPLGHPPAHGWEGTPMVRN